MNSDNEENFVADVLKYFDLTVRKIPIENDVNKRRLSPDFVVSDGEHKYLMELKTKFDNESVKDARKRGMNEKLVYHEITSTERKNNIRTIIKEAAKQLLARRDQENADFCIIILLATGVNEILFREQFKNSLYGKVKLLVKGDFVDVKECFYYTNSDFFNYRDILDGAILIGENNLTLCLNNLSPRYLALKKSSLTQKLLHGVTDPLKLENDNKTFLIDDDIDRDNADALQNYLIEKYDVSSVTPLPMNYITLMSKLDKSIE
ncbi:TPA: hypothetical protein N5L74_000014 [Enterobacter hormaechei subsp. xiangfangensis]|nr:hypothetical protein [Enterobacter hormaechei subsp. xiangfangensis]